MVHSEKPWQAHFEDFAIRVWKSQIEWLKTNFPAKICHKLVMGFCSARLYLQILPRHQPIKKHIGRVTVRNSQKNGIFSTFLIFGPIKNYSYDNLCSIFDFYRIAKACTNILIFDRMQFECNSVTKIISWWTEKSQKFAILFIFQSCVDFQPNKIIILASIRHKIFQHKESKQKWAQLIGFRMS